MSGEAERKYNEKQAESIKRSTDRIRSPERARESNDRLQKTEATDAVVRKIKEARPGEKNAFYKKQRDSIEHSQMRMNSTEKKAFYEDQRKQLESSQNSVDNFARQHKVGDYAEKKEYRVPDPNWFKDK